MSDQSNAAKVNPETLELRGKPRPVTRFRKSVFAGASVIAILLALGVVSKAFQDKAPDAAAKEEKFSVGGPLKSEALAAAPTSYAQVKQPVQHVPSSPEPVLETPKQEGRSVEADDLKNERLRLRQKARDAREAGVFFQISQARGMAAGTTGGLGSSSGSACGSASGALSYDSEQDQNNQQGKQEFLSRQGAASTYNPYPLQDAVSPYQVMAGSVISASLLTGINSDLPGFVTAQVTENVFDTATGRFLLIPQGARLIGRYDSVVTYGQKRALLVWHRLVLPDASSISLENLPATDTSGYAGLADKVDAHTWQLIKAVALSTMLGVGTEIGIGDDEGDFIRAVRESTQMNVNRDGRRIVERNLNIQPTITIRQGWPLRVIVHKDLILRPYRGK
jgi:type IV secretion system protein VirB10